MKKLLATIGIIAALICGALILNSVVPASAGPLSPQAVDQTSSSSSTASSSSTPACGTRATLKDVLDKLVADGTITQDQETKILDAVKAAHDSNKSARAGTQARAPKVKAIQEAAQVSADKIGITIDELKTAVKGGQSVADLATAHNVAPADVEKAIVDAGTAKIDAAVTAGTITDQQGGFLKARLPEMANTFVNHVGGAKANACGPAAGSDSSSSSSSGG
jgi:polyhydroxyalkanoate synthesis regulator phasin